MIYATLEKNKVDRYPADPRADNPNISFPENWIGGLINGVLYVPVVPQAPPVVPLGWFCEEGQPEFKEDKWVQSYMKGLLSAERLKSMIHDLHLKHEAKGVTYAGVTFPMDQLSEIR